MISPVVLAVLDKPAHAAYEASAYALVIDVGRDDGPYETAARTYRVLAVAMGHEYLARYGLIVRCPQSVRAGQIVRLDESGEEVVRDTMIQVRPRVLSDVNAERERHHRLHQQGKFPWTCDVAGVPNASKLAVLAEEFGEVAREVCEEVSGRPADVSTRRRLREELVQVAAGAVAWVEGLYAEERP